MDFSKASFEQLLAIDGHECACGHQHGTELRCLKIGPGAIRSLQDALLVLEAHKPFVVCDKNTYAAAWSHVAPLLEAARIPYVLHLLEHTQVEPDEFTIGSLCMAFDTGCDVIMAIGSGVINDCCKVLAHVSGRRSIVIATAPSMDGYASNSSSMIQNRVKVSLYNSCPSAIIADTDILKDAPMRMLQAGLGDMLAKHISLCEWRISHIVTGEYYCENIAGLVRTSLKKCISAADGLERREPAAIQSITEGLVLSGIAMSYAKFSRPASGLEHYFSHLWEMMALDRGKGFELHGIQVGVGTYLTLRLYDAIRLMVPSRLKAEAFIAGFDNSAWEEEMRGIFGKAADAIITDEHTKFHKNDPPRHAVRLHAILTNWNEIQTIISQELPATVTIRQLMNKMHMPMTPADLGISPEDTQAAFIGSRDIRDKYLTSSLLWDLGLLHEIHPLE
jgi:glycerol-1-phosphate dehydrogenase [NAD(P)+]